MAMGLPVIATDWSGPTAYMTPQNSYPLRINGTEQVPKGEEGHRWAVPSVPHMKELMRFVSTNKGAAGEIGKQARADMMADFSPAVIAKQVSDRIAAVQGFAQATAAKGARKEEL
jgi:hypothetical protein